MGHAAFSIADMLPAVVLLMLSTAGVGVGYHQQQQHPTSSWPAHECLSREDGAWLEEVARNFTYSYVMENDFSAMLRGPSADGSSACPPQHPVSLERVLFVVMCSKDLQERIKWLAESWLVWVPSSNVVLLAETEIPGYNITVLPPLGDVDEYVDARHPHTDSYQAANLRHLKSIVWLGRGPAAAALQDIDWVFMVDDDTYVDPPALLSFLGPFPPLLPVLFGFIMDCASNHGFQLQNVTFPWGGAGMLFSKAGFTRLAAVLFSEQCGLLQNDGYYLNDVVVGNCSVAAGVLKVHCKGFQPRRVSALRALGSGRRRKGGGFVTVHQCREEGQALQYACLTAERAGWPHGRCSEHATVMELGMHTMA